LTNTITAGVIGFLGDRLAVQVSKAGIRHDESDVDVDDGLYRSLSMAAWGSVVSGPSQFAWFSFLDKLIPPPTSTSGKELLKVFGKIAVNQFTMAPLMNALFYGWVVGSVAAKHAVYNEAGEPVGTVSDALAAIRDPSTAETWMEKLQKEMIPTTLRSVGFWFPAHAINFWFVPPQFRVLYASCGLVVWTSYLSWVGHSGKSVK
jgi:protein Mpv17